MAEKVEVTPSASEEEVESRDVMVSMGLCFT
jgi:hypothetical protein